MKCFLAWSNFDIYSNHYKLHSSCIYTQTDKEAKLRNVDFIA